MGSNYIQNTIELLLRMEQLCFMEYSLFISKLPALKYKIMLKQNASGIEYKRQLFWEVILKIASHRKHINYLCLLFIFCEFARNYTTWKCCFANWNRLRLNYNSKMPSFMHMSRSYTVLNSHIHTKNRNFCDMNCSNGSELYEFIMWNVCACVRACPTYATITHEWLCKWNEKPGTKKVAFTHTKFSEMKFSSPVVV